MDKINKQIFLERLRSILKLRRTLDQQAIKDVLNKFWQFNKQRLDTIYLWSCYETVKRVMQTFRTAIEASRGRYYYVHNSVLLQAVY